VGLGNLVTPVATTHWYDRQLGQDDGSSNSCGHFLGALDTQANVTIEVTNSCKIKKDSITAGNITNENG
jgi:hypothetical protein